MEVSHKSSHGIHTIQIEGEINSETLQVIHHYVHPLSDEARTKRVGGLIIDMSKVVFIHSGGIAFLCAQHISLKKLGKKLIIVNPQGKVWQVIQNMNLNTIFNIFPDKLSALNELIHTHTYGE